jgi:putative MFS transporter
MIGFVLMISIYGLVIVCFAVYIPELFPTEVRLRASGICNTCACGATIVTLSWSVALFRHYGVGGVIGMLVGLLVIEIILVLIFGMEPKNRRLEEITYT